jgi:hypothetical protein
MAEQSNVPVNLLRQPPERTVADRRRRLEERHRPEVMPHEADDRAADVVTVDGVDVEPIEQRRGQRHAGLFVAGRFHVSPRMDCRPRLAEIVADGAQHHGGRPPPVESVEARASLVHDHQGMRPHIPFGMPLRILLAGGERQQLGE